MSNEELLILVGSACVGAGAGYLLASFAVWLAKKD